MNIAGLNNLAFAQSGAAAKPAAHGPSPAAPMSTSAARPMTSSSSKAGSSRDAKKSSFEEILGQKQQGKAETPSQARAEAPRARDIDKENTGEGHSDGEVHETSLDSENLPAAGQPLPLAPGGMPAQDRMMTPPNQTGAAAVQVGPNKAAPAVSKDEAVDALTRRVVWSDFLRKMKDELGVSAEDVLKAFQSLSAEDLAKPPAQTLDTVVMALGLNPQQQILAKQYFQELIQKTQPHSLGEELQSSGKQINLTLMSQREIQRRTEQAGLDRFNQNFFMKGPYARPMNAMPAGPDALKAQQAPQLDGKTDRMLNNEDEDAQQIDPRLVGLTSPADGRVNETPQTPVAPMPTGPNPPISTPRPQQASMASSRAMKDLTAQMKPVSSDDRSVDQVVQKFMSAQAPSQMTKAKIAALMSAGPEANAAAAAGASAAGAVPQTAPLMSASAMNNLLGKLKDGGVQDDTGADGGETSDASYLTTPLSAGDAKMGGAAQAGNDFKAQLSQAANPAAAQPMTVPDLVQQAQIMVKDGGGEMKVTMHPEGLGEVAMKVSVEQGKVSVQMITESDEAKRLIERQLGDLKSSLASNHLNVGEIKIDTASGLGRQLEQQYQDAQRQSTQSQWEQFRQDNQGWRRSFFDTPTVRQYRGQAEAPRDVQAPNAVASARARAGSGGNKRLDLVA